MGKREDEKRIREIMEELKVSRERAIEILWVEQQDDPGDTYTVGRDGEERLDPPEPVPDWLRE